MKAIYDTITAQLLPWPRMDDEPVVGLAPHLLEMQVVQNDKPDYDKASQFLTATESVNVDLRIVTRGYVVSDIPPATYSAEQWIEGQGYTATRLVSLLDVEAKLVAANKSSDKTTAVRLWLDTLLLSFVVDPTPRPSWDNAPFTYEETIADAMIALQA